MSIGLFILGLLIIIISILYFKNVRKNRNKSRKKMSNIVGWMEMSRDERHALDLKDKKISMKRKKVLLDEIRKEYVRVSGKGNKRK